MLTPSTLVSALLLTATASADTVTVNDLVYSANVTISRPGGGVIGPARPGPWT